MPASLDSIVEAFQRVKTSVELAVDGDEAARERSFEEIFELNNEIGKVARTGPAAMRRMKELQLCVNMVTVGVKQGSREGATEGLSATEESIKALREEER